MSIKPLITVPSAVGRGALDELAGVPWETLKHAYGKGRIERRGRNPLTGETIVSCTPSPDEILRSLVADDADERDEALNDGLFAVLWHQGSIYDATAYAVPFLAALAADAAVPARDAIVTMLLLVARSACSDEGDVDDEKCDNEVALTRRAFQSSAQHLSTMIDVGPAAFADAGRVLVHTMARRFELSDEIECAIDSALESLS